MPTVLITGTTGLVGSYLTESLRKKNGWDICGVSRSRGACVDQTVDLADRKSVIPLKNLGDFDVVVHTAAMTKTDLCENNKPGCHMANVVATKNLAETFPAAKFVFFSTYAVYNTPKGNCTEDTPVLPTNHYIATKIEAEGIVRAMSDMVIVRPSVIFGYTTFSRETKNYFMHLLENVRNKKITQSPTDQFFNPIHVNSVGRLIRGLIEKDSHGIYNIGCNENTSKFEFNRCVMERFGFDMALLQGIESRNLQIVRPNNGTVSSQKIQKDLGCPIPPLTTMIDDLYGSTQGAL